MSKHFESACQLAIFIAKISEKNMYHCHDTMSYECTTEINPQYNSTTEKQYDTKQFLYFP